jgi:hypothetical protein
MRSSLLLASTQGCAEELRPPQRTGPSTATRSGDACIAVEASIASNPAQLEAARGDLRFRKNDDGHCGPFTAGAMLGVLAAMVLDIVVFAASRALRR